MPKSEDCVMCQEPVFVDKGTDDPRRIADLEVSTAVVNRDWQFYRGSAILVLQDHVTELHHLDPDVRLRFIDDACRLAAALENAFKPQKLNHAMLGNAVPHLHWHMVPRYSSHPHPTYAIWEHDIPVTRPADEEFRKIADEIRLHL